MNTARGIRSEAMALSASERAGLAHDLILSLENPADFELGPKQEAEIARRLRMIREGTATGRPADEVLAEFKAKHK